MKTELRLNALICGGCSFCMALVCSINEEKSNIGLAIADAALSFGLFIQAVWILCKIGRKVSPLGNSG